ncbi:MAG: 5-formyltetrahydrofolate cyclo-ligase [Planctomycetota bacterium]
MTHAAPPDKAELRRRVRAARGRLAPDRVAADSDRLRARVLTLPELAAARCVFVYASHGTEPHTYTLIEDLLALGKTVSVPRVTDAAHGRMEAIPLTSLKDLAPAAFGVLAPRHGRPLDQPPDLALVPGLAFDPRTGHRLGQGAGFYDRYLADHPQTLPIGLVFESQLLSPLPLDPHDRRVRIIVTETSIHRPPAPSEA